MPGLQNAKSTLDYLNTIGSNDRGDTLHLNETAKSLVELSELLIRTASENMEQGANVATGETIASMKSVNLVTNATRMSIDVEILGTYKFLDQGVKGTQGGSGKYQFKNSYPNKKMATAILQWVRKRGLSGKVKYKAKSRNEAKNKRLHKIVKKSDDYKSLAYAIATNIKKKGIRRTLFFTKAIAVTQKETKKILGKGIKADIINSLNELNNN